MNKIVSIIRHLFPAVLFSCLLVSCSDDSYQSRLRELLIDDMTFQSQASSQEVTFRHEDLSNYDCQSSDDWCTVSFDVANSKMKVSVTANATYDPRSATVTLADRLDSSVKRSFTVTQKRNTGLFVDKTDFEVPIEGGSITVSLKSNVDYVVDIPTDCDWLKLAPEAKTRGLDSTAFTLIASGNTTYHDRTALVTVTNKAEGLSGTVTVYQPFTTVFSADSTSFEMPMDASTFTVNVASNIPYDIVIPDDCDWITSSIKNHKSPLTADSTAVVFSVKENKGYKDRSAVITLNNKDAGVSVAINVSQPFTAVFNPDKKSFDVPMEGGTVTVNMESNISYDVIIPDDCDWITLPDASRSKTRGTTTSAVVLKVKENPGYKDRDATVTICNKDAGVEVKVAIHQPFITTFKVDKTAFDVDMAGGTITVNLESNIPYEVTIPDDCKSWITQPTATRKNTRSRAKTRATNTSALVFRVSENTTYQDREAVITIGNKEAGAEAKIYIHQPFTTTFSVDKNAFDVDMAGGTVTVNLTHNISYEVKIPDGCNWITLPTTSNSKTRSGTRAATETTPITFRVSENSTYQDREAVITISNKEAGAEAKIYIHQPFATTFKLDNNEFEVDMKGGTVTINVESNVSYEVNIPSGCNWITQSKSSRTRATKSSVVILNVAENTTGSDRSAVVTIGNTTVGVSSGVTIKQPFKSTFNVDATPLAIDELGGTLSVSVSSNVGVTVTSLADWLTVGNKVSGGNGNWTQQINVGRFTAKKESRQGSVKFINTATNESVVVTVTQSRTLFVAESGIDLTDTEKSKPLTLTNTNGLPVVWSSSDTQVATVNSTGTVTAVATGKCVVTVKSSDGKYYDTCNVTVDLPLPPEEAKETGDEGTKETGDEGSKGTGDGKSKGTGVKRKK